MSQSICVKPNHNGFFVNFNQVVDWLAFGAAHGIRVGVDWRIEQTGPDWDFNYGGADANVWNNYFAPLPCAAPASLIVDRPWTPYLGGFRGFRLYAALETSRASAMLRPLQLALARQVRLREFLQQRVDTFAAQFAGHVLIGVHLRNPVASRGYYSRFQGIELVARKVERIVSGLTPHQDWRIFAASDREGMIEALARHFPGKVIWQQEITRAAKDAVREIHIDSPPSRDLGAEVISDCWLLSRCDHLVGAQSSVCLAACIINPALTFHYARTGSLRAAARLEYWAKTAWCALFESPPSQIAEARRLAGI